MTPKEIRQISIQTVKSLGLNMPDRLPTLEGLELRDVGEIIGRTLGMCIVSATAYGLSRSTAIEWLNREALTNFLSARERRFILSETGCVEPFKTQIEGIWALAWELGLIENFEFDRSCDSDFVTIFPDFKSGEDSKAFQSKVSLRTYDEICRALDLAYCIHWCIRQASLTNATVPPTIRPYIVVERRRALEWTLSKQNWDDIALDT